MQLEEGVSTDNWKDALRETTLRDCSCWHFLKNHIASFLTSTNSLIFWHQLGAQQFKSYTNYPVDTDPIPQNCPFSRCQLKMWCPGYPHFCPDNYKFKGLYNFIFRFGNSVDWLTEFRKVLCLQKPVHYKRKLRKSQMVEVYRGECGGGVQRSGPLCAPQPAAQWWAHQPGKLPGSCCN